MFVQSTSYNRILLPDTEFLYDTGEKDSTAVSDEAVKVDSAATVDASKTEPSTSRGAGRGKRKKAGEEVHSILLLIKFDEYSWEKHSLPVHRHS